eukprot:4763899-Prymnesium_polylepis.1
MCIRDSASTRVALHEARDVVDASVNDHLLGRVELLHREVGGDRAAIVGHAVVHRVEHRRVMLVALGHGGRSCAPEAKGKMRNGGDLFQSGDAW